MNFDAMRAFSENAITEAELNEMAKLEKYDLYQQDARQISDLLKQAKRESDPKKMKKLYQDALSNAKKLRAKAASIPDESVGDWMFNLLIKPWWWFLSDAFAAASKGDSLSEMSKSQAVAHYDRLIKKIETSINSL